MANILSQNEIDELLSAINSGEDVEKQETPEEANKGNLRVYDFRTANKFSKEQMKTLDIIFDNYSYLMSTRLTGMLRTICEVEVSAVEEQKFGEFNNSIPSPSVIAITNVEPFQGQILFQISQNLAYAMISRVFGGNAENSNWNKSFTEIELVILENIVKQFTLFLEEAWDKIVDISTSLDRIETSSQFTQIAALNEPSAIIAFNVSIDDVEDTVSICIPHVALQPVIKKLNSAAWTLGTAARNLPKVDSKSEDIEGELDDAEATMYALFNETRATMDELYHMKVGDVVVLDHNINDYITVYLEDIPKFKGIIGVSGNKKVVQIAKTIKESNETDE